MCHEYWHEKKQMEEAEERARREAQELIRKAKEAKPQAPVTAPAETEKVPA